MKRIKSIIFLLSLATFNFSWADTVCFDVQGMTCPLCPFTIKTAIEKLSGIKKVTTSLEKKNAVVDFDAKKTNVIEIKKSIDGAGSYAATQKNCN